MRLTPVLRRARLRVVLQHLVIAELASRKPHAARSLSTSSGIGPSRITPPLRREQRRFAVASRNQRLVRCSSHSKAQFHGTSAGTMLPNAPDSTLSFWPLPRHIQIQSFLP